MRALLGIVLTVWLTLLVGHPALADKRVALVIGNSSYRNVAKLSNPANDAAAVAAMFKSAGFNTVESKLNLTVSELRKTLRDFGNKSRDADVAVVYYAGHGIELDGTNYLIPIDATLETDTDVLDETLSLDRVLFAVEPAKQSSARHPRCLPGQPVCKDHEADDRVARDRPRPCQGRTVKPEHDDRLCRQGRIDRIRRRSARTAHLPPRWSIISPNPVSTCARHSALSATTY